MFLMHVQAADFSMQDTESAVEQDAEAQDSAANNMQCRRGGRHTR